LRLDWGMPSSARQSDETAPRVRVAPEEVLYRQWPLGDQPLRSLALLVAAALASGLVAVSVGHWLAGCVVALALLIVLWRTWLPVKYEITGQGIYRTVLGRRRLIAWAAIRGHRVLPGGVLLLPDETFVPAAPLRGLFLPFGPHRTEVLAHLEYYLRDWHVTTRSQGHRR
jgi:hypothetical protein